MILMACNRLPKDSSVSAAKVEFNGFTERMDKRLEFEINSSSDTIENKD